MPLEEIAPDARDPLDRPVDLRACEPTSTGVRAISLRGVVERAGEAPCSRAARRRAANLAAGASATLKSLPARSRSLSGSSRKPFGLLEMTLGFLAAGTLSSFGDQWIVTDFTVADLVSAATARWGPPSRAEPGSLVSRLETQELELIEPTFIVDGNRQVGDWPELGAHLRSTPRLRLESEALTRQVSEILDGMCRDPNVNGLQALLVLASLCYAFIIPS